MAGLDSFAEVFLFFSFFYSLRGKSLFFSFTLFSKIRLKNSMGHDVLDFPIILQVFEKKNVFALVLRNRSGSVNLYNYQPILMTFSE